MLTRKKINIKRKLRAAFRGESAPVDQCEHDKSRQIAGMWFCLRCGTDLPTEAKELPHVPDPVVETIAEPIVLDVVEVTVIASELGETETETGSV